MSTNLGALVMKLVLEARQFRQDLDQQTRQTEAAVGRLERSTTSMGGAVRDIVEGQSTAAASASRALTVLGPVGAAAALAVGAVTVAYIQGAKEAQAYEKAITLTGNAAGVTVGQMADMARAVDKVVGTQGQAAATLAQMAGSGRIAGENLQKFTITAQEMERSVGTSVEDTVKVFAELGEAPVKASLKLNETMNYLTASTYAQIKAAMELGDEERAASIAQNAYADAMGPRVARIEGSLGTLEKAWRGVKGMAKEAWDAMLNIGREASVDQKLNILREELERRTQRGVLPGRSSESFDKGNEELRQKIALLTEQVRLETRGNEAQTETARTERKRIELAQALEASASKQEKLAKAIASANSLADASGATQAEREQLIAAAREKYAERAVRSAKAVTTEQEKQAQAGEKLAASLMAQESGLSGDFAQKWAQLNAAYEQNGWSVEKLTAAQADLLAQQPAMKAGMAAQTKEAAEIAKAMEAAAKATAAGVAEAERAATQAEWQLATYGMLKSEVQALTLAQLEQARESAALAGEDVSNIEKRIAATKRLITATRGIEQREDLDKTIKETTEAGQKMADSINGSLTDALMRGFESGKDFAKNMRDTIVNMFKTMVLRPVISAVLSPISGAISGVMGGGQSSGGGLLGGINTASSLNSLYGAGSQALFGGAAGASAASLGYANIVGAAGGDALGALASANGMWAGVATGAQAAAQSAIAANLALEAGTAAALPAGTAATAAGAASGGISGALGAIPGWGWALAGVAALAAIFGKGKTYHSGGAASYSAEGGVTTGLGVLDQGLTFGVGSSHYDPAVEKTSAAITKSIVGMLDSTAVAFGNQAGYYAATAFADDSSKDGAWGSLIIRRLDETVLNWADTQTSKWAPKEFSDGAAGQAEYAAALAASVRDAVKTAVGDVGWAQDLIGALGDTPTLEGITTVVGTINAAAAALDKMGQNLAGFAALSDSAVSALVKASGGMDGFIANASAYYDAFYSDAEKSANVLRDVDDTLAAVGLSAPKNKDELRAMVEANQALGEEGVPAVAAIFSVAGAFSEVTDAADAAAAALKSSVQGGIDSLAKSLGDMHKGVADADAQVAAARMSIWSGYNAAQTELIDLEKQSAEATRGFARSLREYVAGLSTGPNSSRGLESNYLALQRQFSSTAGKAGAGDQDARDSLTTIADQYLEASRARSRTSVEYARDSARVAVALGNLATKAEGDPLVQKYNDQNLTLQQQIADAQINVVKYLALMEATGTSTDLGIQTVDSTLQGLRDAYVSAEQAQAAANLKLDVALAALDALGLTEQLVNVLAGGQTNSLSAALNISDEALASITGALGLTPENVADLATEFGVEVALLVGNAATELADTLAGALAFDPAAFDALKTVVDYDTESPDFAALRTILGFDLESGKFQALQTILGFAPEAVVQIDSLAGGVGFSPDAAVSADALAAGIVFAATATEQIDRIAAGVSLTDIAAGQVDALAAGIGWADGAQVDGLLSGVGWGDGVGAQMDSLIGGLHLTDAASAQVQGLLDGLSLAPADRLTITSLLAGIGFTPETQTAVETGIGLQPGVMDSLGSALGLTAEARNAVSVLSTFGSIEATVKNAYAQIGRSGIGTAANQIDQGGFDYWKGQLASGAVRQEDFLQTFLASAAQGTRENPDSIYADYVSQYLKKLGIPGFAVGTNYVPSDMLAMLHKGEAVVPAAYNPAAGNSGGDNREVVAELRALRAELATHKAELASIRTSSSTTATGMTGIVNKQVVLATEAA